MKRLSYQASYQITIYIKMFNLQINTEMNQRHDNVIVIIRLSKKRRLCRVSLKFKVDVDLIHINVFISWLIKK